MEAASSTVVIKVKHGKILRRFNAQIVEGKLDLSMDGLKTKIYSLFSLNPDTELVLTYIDEDTDVVTLVDNEDLRDVVKQGLNPLRITVKVGTEKNGRQDNQSSASSTPLRSPPVLPILPPNPELPTGVYEKLKRVPEPMQESLMKLVEMVFSLPSSAPTSIAELVNNFSKVGLSSSQGSQSGVESSMQGGGGVPGSNAGAKETNNSGPLKVNPNDTSKGVSNVRPQLSAAKNKEKMEKRKPETTSATNEVKAHHVTGGIMMNSSSGLNDVGEASGSQNINVGQTDDDHLQNLARAYSRLGGIYPTPIGVKEKPRLDIDLNEGSESDLTVHKLNGADNIWKLGESSAPITVSNTATVAASEPKKGASIWAPGPGSLYFPPPTYGSFPMYGCPFSGIPMEPVTVAPPQPASESVPFRRSISQNDVFGNIFHRGVRCDGCGVHPITGPRFKSKVKVDYDLCSICFEEMGDHSDYIRMDRPAVYRHHMPPLKGLHDAVQRSRDRNPIMQHIYKGSKIKPGAVKLDSRFILDVNIFDGTVMAPLTPFTKIWRMRNNGTVVWPQKTQLVWIGGDKLSNELSVEVQIPITGLMADQEIDVAVDFISPELPGRYISYWRLASPSGQKFGQRVWVLIQVDASANEIQPVSARNLNLNLPPVSSGIEIINIKPEPMVEDKRPETDNSKRIVESVQPNTDQELKFPINDSLLVGSGPSSSLPTSSATVSYPIIDLSDVAPPLPPVPPPMFYPMPQAIPSSSTAPVASAPLSGVDLPRKKEVEEKLLKELEEMGFKQVDLNKEVLRMNEYDLEQAVDDLCGVAEWDPILEELQEMGFRDTEVNKMLLKKNNGSIKRVVMDLIAGEKP